MPGKDFDNDTVREELDLEHCPIVSDQEFRERLQMIRDQSDYQPGQLFVDLLPNDEFRDHARHQLRSIPWKDRADILLVAWAAYGVSSRSLEDFIPELPADVNDLFKTQSQQGHEHTRFRDFTRHERQDVESSKDAMLFIMGGDRILAIERDPEDVFVRSENERRGEDSLRVHDPDSPEPPSTSMHRGR